MQGRFHVKDVRGYLLILAAIWFDAQTVIMNFLFLEANRNSLKRSGNPPDFFQTKDKSSIRLYFVMSDPR